MRPVTDNTLCWIGLSSIPGVGRATFRKLTRHFGSPCAALGASLPELREAGIPDRTARSIASSSWRGAAEDEARRAEAAGVGIITFGDEEYPDALRRTPDPPLFLYIKGRFLPADRSAVAIVGTRTPTHYGRTMARRIAGDLAGAGHTIVSGLARGIDTEAHAGALAAKGRTIAVLGCGIDTAYPPENRGLMERIAEQGAVVTENPFGTRPEAGYFPARNRIISGLAQGTVIVEAASDSGSLITAEFTLKHKRMLFAVPGNAGSPVSRGTNNLIRQGAVLAEDAADVLSRIGRAPEQRDTVPGTPVRPLPPEEAGILARLGAEPMHIDVILAESGGAAGKLGGILLSLELQGLVRQLPGKYFVLAAER